MVQRATYSKELKLQIVREIDEDGKTVSQEAHDHAIPQTTIRGWLRLYRERGERAFDKEYRVSLNWQGLIRGAVALLISIVFILTIKSVLGSHMDLSTRAGLGAMETSVFILLLTTFFIRDVLALVGVMERQRDPGHLRLKIQEVLLILGALAASLLIYESIVLIRYGTS